MREYSSQILNQPIDVSREFSRIDNVYYNCDSIKRFDSETGYGELEWKRYERKIRTSFNNVYLPMDEADSWDFPPVYDKDPTLPFRISFVSARTLRLQIWTRREYSDPFDSPMLVDGAPGVEEAGSDSVDYTAAGAWNHDVGTPKKGHGWSSSFGRVMVEHDPFRLRILDDQGRELTRTQHHQDSRCLQKADPTPLSFVKRITDLTQHTAATFSLTPDEMIFGGGESFTRLNKRGQRIVLCTSDPLGVQTAEMYKPIPFFMSNRGYGMFVHTGTPVTFDFGCSYDAVTTIFNGDDVMDIFVFFGGPAEILQEYTALTGRSPLPPLWSFGLWFGRCSYTSQQEVEDTAARLRSYRIPADDLHVDTGWFEREWICDYEFSRERFPEPGKMIERLRSQGLRLSLWQLPYSLKVGSLFPEIVEKGLAVKGAGGGLASTDAVFDFTNNEAVDWYQSKLRRLLKMGVAAIKADFGESAPIHGLYASGRSGFYEHNLYPLLYNRAVAEVTKEVTGEHIIWARSAWAGSQRYPVHWGGDAENTDNGMAASLRAGLSLGLSGFSYWSHDIGGLVIQSPEELYRRWLPFGMLSSHSRIHGHAPTEPWYYNDTFVDYFRDAVELKYRLMPYVYSQAVVCSSNGWPMIRPLFFEYPADRTAWLIEDQYMFGREILVAPLFREGCDRRDVYLPEGTWTDYQTNDTHGGGAWRSIQAGALSCVILVREDAVIPLIDLAQSTNDMDWTRIELKVYTGPSGTRQVGLHVPSAHGPRPVSVSITISDAGMKVRQDDENVSFVATPAEDK
jgi:alpha-D-xyloside xylohydrolase